MVVAKKTPNNAMMAKSLTVLNIFVNDCSLVSNTTITAIDCNISGLNFEKTCVFYRSGPGAYRMSSASSLTSPRFDLASYRDALL